jgi:hypothetical protein
MLHEPRDDLARALLGLGDLSGALDRITYAVELCPQHPLVWGAG